MNLTTGGRRRVDLGRIDPSCKAEYHGTNAADHKAKCRCPHAREAHRLYLKRAKYGRLEPVLVDATGTRRRVQGMWALGHPTEVIVGECDGRFTRPQVVRFCQQERITPVSRDLVAVAYQKLIVRPGKSSRTRLRAQAAGYPLPVQWGADIDDPDAVPEPLDEEPPVYADLDEVAVELALKGRPVRLSDHELIAAVHAGVARGLDVMPLAELLRVDWRLVKRLTEGDVPPRLSSIVRHRTERLVAA